MIMKRFRLAFALAAISCASALDAQTACIPGPNGAECIQKTAPWSGSPVIDGSTTITAGGTAQNLFGGAIPVNRWAVYNPHATADLWCSDSTTAAANAAGSVRIVANGGGYETPLGYKPTKPVSCVGATTGQPITARSW